MERIKVFLDDSQVVFREGMHLVLESEEAMEVVGEGRTAEEALAFLREQPVDVLVLSEDIVRVANRIIERFPFVGLILVGDTYPRQRQLAAEDSIFLTRDVDPEELVRAVRKVSRNSHRTQKQSRPDEIGEFRQSLRERLLSLVESL